MDLQDAINELAGVSARAYSGRGMNGKECLGATVDDPIRFALQLGLVVGEYNASCSEYVDQPIHIPDVSTDGMGKQTIVYFPTVPFKE